MLTSYSCHNAEKGGKEFLTFQDEEHEENSTYSTVFVCVLSKDLERYPRSNLTTQGICPWKSRILMGR
jgi:hypothetical protein